MRLDLSTPARARKNRAAGLAVVTATALGQSGCGEEAGTSNPALSTSGPLVGMRSHRPWLRQLWRLRTAYPLCLSFSPMVPGGNGATGALLLRWRHSAKQTTLGVVRNPAPAVGLCGVRSASRAAPKEDVP